MNGCFLFIFKINTQAIHESTVPNKQVLFLQPLAISGTLSINHFNLNALNKGDIGRPHVGLK